MTGAPRLAGPVLGLAMAVLAGSCSGGPILANAPAERPSPPPRPTLPAPPADPAPLVFPRDDGPHRRLTEWWYYTGHLQADDGHRYGFEFVIFRAERGDFPVSWASHLAVTDETDWRFAYAQRSEIGPAADRSPRDPSTGEPTGFDLAVGSSDPAGEDALAPWTMRGAGGRDRLEASVRTTEAAAAGIPGGLELALDMAPGGPPVAHDGDGWVDFGPAGGSYYYSRTRLAATGSLTFDGKATPVSGTAWFDHQWGDFISVGGGGWDWFAVNLDDGTDLTLSLVRAADGTLPLVYGTFVDRTGSVRHLDRTAFAVEATGQWESPATGARYPSGWRITLEDPALEIELEPTVLDQELDTRATTGVVYWEGSQRVRAMRDGRPIGGEAYVELTGYAPAVDR